MLQVGADRLRGAIRTRVVAAYDAAARDWHAAPTVMAQALRDMRELHSRERRLVSDALWGMVRLKRWLAFAALGTDEASAEVLFHAWLVLEGGIGFEEWRPALSAGGVDTAFLADREARLAAIPEHTLRIAVRQSVPDWLVARLAAQWSLDEVEAFLRASNARAPLTVRANRLRGTREELMAALRAEGVTSRATLLAPDGVVLETHKNAYGLKAFTEGRFEVQDEGSQLVAELVAPPPGGTVVDACAGAGGKTLALGALLGNRGRVLALDVGDKKLAELRKRVKRAGLTNVEARVVRPDGDLPTVAAERVLCDVPCSGLGVLRRNPEARWRLSPADLDELPAKQRAILARYAALVAPGGRLIYATCSVMAAENDAVVDGFVASTPGFVTVPAKEIWGSERALAAGDGERLRVMPNVHGCDGFFGAVLRRKR